MEGKPRGYGVGAIVVEDQFVVVDGRFVVLNWREKWNSTWSKNAISATKRILNSNVSEW